MVTATARRAALPALLALAALLALPNAAHAALSWKSCVDFRGVKCATLTVPLDRAGVDPGTVPLRIARVGKTTGPTMMYLSGGPGGAGVSEMLASSRSLPAARGPLPDHRLRPARHRPLRAAALPARSRRTRTCATPRAAEDCANRIGVARHHYTTPDSVEDMEAIRPQLGVEKLTLFGISYGTELAIAYARAYPAARRAADPRLDRRRRRPRPVRDASTSARWARRCSRCARPSAAGISARPGRPTSAKLVAQLRAASRCRPSPTTRSAARTGSRSARSRCST